MADERISITWDEVNSPEVDSRLERQSALQRAHEHYLNQRARQGPQGGPGAPPVVRPGRSRLWYNRAVYMALFGILGGLLAWSASEAFNRLYPNPFLEMQQIDAQRGAILARLQRGDILSMEAEAQFEQLLTRHASNPYARILMDKTISDSQKQQMVRERSGKDQLVNRLHRFIWYALVGLFFATTLCTAEHVMGRHWRAVVVNGAVAMTVAVIGALVIGLFINHIYDALGGGRIGISLRRQIAARAVVWAIFGLFLTIGPGLVLWNFKRFFIGMAGGFLGGFLGGLLFDPVTRFAGNNDMVGRLVALLAIGVLAGIATGLIEAAAKAGWLKVTSGLIAGKQFIIYRNPTYLGSSPICEVYLFNDPSVAAHHAAIHTVRGGYELEDLNDYSQTYLNGKPILRARLRSGDEIQVGASTFLFQERKQTVALS